MPGDCAFRSSCHPSLVGHLALQIRHDDTYLIDIVNHPRLQHGFGVEMQLQALADVGKRHLVAGLVLARAGVWIAHDSMDLLPGPVDIDGDEAGLDLGLYSVIHGVLEQRLEHERRNQRIARHPLHLPLDPQPLAQPQLLEVEILPAQVDLARERSQLAVIRHQHAEQGRHVFQHFLRPPRALADQGQHGIDAVEQEMGTYARLQRLQPRFRESGRKRAVSQLEVVEQRDGDEQHQQQVAQQRRRLDREQGTARFVDQRREHELDEYHREYAELPRKAPQPVVRGHQGEQAQYEQRLYQGGDLQQFAPRRVQFVGLEDSRSKGDDVHDEQYAQQHAEVAEIRQGAGVGILIYTSCHLVSPCSAQLSAISRLLEIRNATQTVS